MQRHWSSCFIMSADATGHYHHWPNPNLQGMYLGKNWWEGSTWSYLLGSLVVPGSCGCSSCGTQTHQGWTPQWWSSPPGEGADEIWTRSSRQKLREFLYRHKGHTEHSYHSNDVEGHEVQPAPVARHRGDSFLEGSDSSSSRRSQTVSPIN